MIAIGNILQFILIVMYAVSGYRRLAQKPDVVNEYASLGYDSRWLFLVGGLEIFGSAALILGFVSYRIFLIGCVWLFLLNVIKMGMQFLAKNASYDIIPELFFIVFTVMLPLIRMVTNTSV